MHLPLCGSFCVFVFFFSPVHDCKFIQFSSHSQTLELYNFSASMQGFFSISFLFIPLYPLIFPPLSFPPTFISSFISPLVLTLLLPLPGVQPRQLELLGSLGCVLQNLRRRVAVRSTPVQQPAATEQRALLHGQESHLSVLQRHTMSPIK